MDSADLSALECGLGGAGEGTPCNHHAGCALLRDRGVGACEKDRAHECCGCDCGLLRCGIKNGKVDDKKVPQFHYVLFCAQAGKVNLPCLFAQERHKEICGAVQHLIR